MASDPQDGGPCVNTDRHLWPETSDPHAERESIHVTAHGAIGINVGGYVYEKPLREWHKLAGGKEAMQPAREVLPSKDVTDGIEWLRAAAGATRGNIVPFPQPLAVALLLRFEALEVELRKYDPSFPGETLTTPPQSPETGCVRCNGTQIVLDTETNCGGPCPECSPLWRVDTATPDLRWCAHPRYNHLSHNDGTVGCGRCGAQSLPPPKAAEEPAPCGHLRSELLAEKTTNGEPLFQMRKCLDCTLIFRVRSSVKTSCRTPSIDKPPQLITASASIDGGAPPSRSTSSVECPKCRTQLAFEGDVCGLCP